MTAAQGMSPTRGFVNQASALHTLSGTLTQSPQESGQYWIDLCHTQGLLKSIYRRKSPQCRHAHILAQAHRVAAGSAPTRVVDHPGDKELTPQGGLPLTGGEPLLGRQRQWWPAQPTVQHLPPTDGLSRSRRPPVHWWRPLPRPGCPPGLSASRLDGRQTGGVRGPVPGLSPRGQGRLARPALTDQLGDGSLGPLLQLLQLLGYVSLEVPAAGRGQEAEAEGWPGVAWAHLACSPSDTKEPARTLRSPLHPPESSTRHPSQPREAETSPQTHRTRELSPGVRGGWLLWPLGHCPGATCPEHCGPCSSLHRKPPEGTQAVPGSKFPGVRSKLISSASNTSLWRCP